MGAGSTIPNRRNSKEPSRSRLPVLTRSAISSPDRTRQTLNEDVGEVVVPRPVTSTLKPKPLATTINSNKSKRSNDIISIPKRQRVVSQTAQQRVTKKPRPTPSSSTEQSLPSKVQCHQPYSLPQRKILPTSSPSNTASKCAHCTCLTTSIGALVVKMSYTIPNAHISSPCTHKSLTHRLTCTHLIITPSPTEICAGNCCDSNSNSAMMSLRSLPGNPRDLDTTFICPACNAAAPTKRESKAFGALGAWGKKKGGAVLCQLVPESVDPCISTPLPSRRPLSGKPSESGKESSDGELTPNPLNFSFPGCTPAKKKNDSAMFIPGDEKVATRPPRPRRIISSREGLRTFKLPALASEK